MTPHHVFNTLKIGLDYDGVITDSRAQKHDLALKRYGVDLPTPVFKWPHAVNGGLLTSAQYNDIQHSIHYDVHENQVAPLQDGLLVYLPRVMATHQVRIVTGRDGDALRYATARLSAIGMPLEATGVGSNVSKRAATLGLVVFVDDDLDKLVDLDVPHRFLFSHEYNLHEKVPEGIRRVHSWNDLYTKIQELSEVTE